MYHTFAHMCKYTKELNSIFPHLMPTDGGSIDFLFIEIKSIVVIDHFHMTIFLGHAP